MPRQKIDFDVVREIAFALPDVTESTIHGAPSLKVHGKLLACPALHKSAEPDSLAVKIDVNLRSELIADEPSVYYVTEHYIKYPTVLVRLSQINRKSLSELLDAAWSFVNSKTNTARRTSRSPRRQPRD